MRFYLSDSSHAWKTSSVNVARLLVTGISSVPLAVMLPACKRASATLMLALSPIDAETPQES